MLSYCRGRERLVFHLMVYSCQRVWTYLLHWDFITMAMILRYIGVWWVCLVVFAWRSFYVLLNLFPH